jgi:UDP-N-acetylmuramoylalanine--D-glutamate ligase
MHNQDKQRIKDEAAGKAHIHDRARALLSDIAYRLETIVELKGVEIINDSRATDVASTYYSLELMDKPVVWIAGTNGAEEDHALLEKLLRYKVKAIVSFGKDASGRDFYSQLEPLVDHYSYYTALDVAVVKAWTLCRKGDALLFSPGCPGTDLFTDFRERGGMFNQLIAGISKG